MREKLKQIKSSNPSLKKLHKYQSSDYYFSNQFEIYSDQPLVSSSYIFDASNNIYELHKQLGKGAFGSVKKGVLVNSGQVVAIKIQDVTSQIEYHSKSIGDIDRARIYVSKQIEIEDALLKLTGQLISSLTRVNLHKQEKHYSIMRYIDGLQLKNIFQQLSIQEKIKCFIQITEQLEFLHANEYLHLDIWPDNILYSKGNAILHDYGCSAKLENGRVLSKLKGSHIPPEVILKCKNKEISIYSTYSDVYALGMTFYELLNNEYYDYNSDQSLDDFVRRYVEYHNSIIGHLNSKNDVLSQMISKMISKDAAERPSINKILSRLNIIKRSPNLQTALVNSRVTATNLISKK